MDFLLRSAIVSIGALKGGIILKKVILSVTGICLLGFLIYTVGHKDQKTSTTSKSYEYYYNNESSSTSPSASASAIDGLHNEEIEIDTDPYSLTVLINKEYGLGESFVPDDLVVPEINFDFNYFDEKKLMRAEAASALEELVDAALEEGLQITGVSGYRSYNRQKYIYEKNIKTKGLEYTSKYSAKPGYSEHQSGLAIDVSTPAVNNDLKESFADTPEGLWIAENCYQYGFIVRYPKGKESITGYAYEPWHIRYVGVELATYLTKNNLTLEEYYNYTPSIPNDGASYDNLIEDEGYVPSTPTPTKKPSATKKPTATPQPTESPEPTLTPKPTATVAPTKTPKPSASPSASAKPSMTPQPTTTTAPTATPAPTKTPSITHTPTPAPTEAPTKVPATPEPTKAPQVDSTESEVSSDS